MKIVYYVTVFVRIAPFEREFLTPRVRASHPIVLRLPGVICDRNRRQNWNKSLVYLCADDTAGRNSSNSDMQSVFYGLGLMALKYGVD